MEDNTSKEIDSIEFFNSISKHDQKVTNPSYCKVTDLGYCKVINEGGKYAVISTIS